MFPPPPTTQETRLPSPIHPTPPGGHRTCCTVHRCIWYGPDAEGLNGIYLGLDVVKEASKGLTYAMMRVGRYVLTWGQIGQWLWTEAQRRLLGRKDVAPYSPCFGDCINHFLIHAGACSRVRGCF